MLTLAQSTTGLDVLPVASTAEIVIFFLLIVLVLAGIFARVLFVNGRLKKNVKHSLLELCIKQNALTPQQAALLRRLARREDAKMILKDQDSLLRAFNRYMQARLVKAQEMALAEEALFEVLRSKIHLLDNEQFSSKMIPAGSKVKIRIAGKGLFSAEVIRNNHKGVELILPKWALPEGVLQQKREVILYYWQREKDYEIHSHCIRIKGSGRVRMLISHYNTVFHGKHPGGMGVETSMPVRFHVKTKNVAENASTEDNPDLQQQGTIVCISVIGAEILTDTDTMPGNIYRFTFIHRSGHRHWFEARLMDKAAEENGTRIFVRFTKIQDQTRELIDRFVCRKINRDHDTL